MKVIILRGLPGSGKSSWITRYINENPTEKVVVCSADLFRGLYGDDGKFHRELLHQAHQNCKDEFLRFCQERQPIIFVDNTNTTIAEMVPYFKTGRDLKYEIEIVQLNVSISTSYLRNSHKVPLKTIQQMAVNLEKPVPAWWPKPLVISTDE